MKTAGLPTNVKLPTNKNGISGMYALYAAGKLTSLITNNEF